MTGIIAGIVAIMERPYQPGDWIEVDGYYGEVLLVGPRSLRIKTPSDDIATIHHEIIWNKNISNSNREHHTLMCVITFYLKPRHNSKGEADALRIQGSRD